MGEYHRISGMIEQAGLLNPRLDEGQRRSLKALSSLRAAIKPPPSLLAALGNSWETQSTLDRVRRSIKLAERAVKAKDEDVLGRQRESIQGELSGMVRFLSMAKDLSAHSVIWEYASDVSSGLRDFSLAA